MELIFLIMFATSTGWTAITIENETFRGILVMVSVFFAYWQGYKSGLTGQWNKK